VEPALYPLEIVFQVFTKKVIACGINVQNPELAALV